MTALSLDLRRPVIVLIGAFNPAIFQPGWVASHFFGIPEGADVEVVEVLLQVGRSMVALTFVEGVALHVTLDRLEVFAANAKALDTVEKTLCRLLEVLPHTPVKAIGCNFSWVDSDPAAEVADLFDSPEGFEGTYSVQTRQYTVALELEGAILNFVRIASENAAIFNFNFHREVANAMGCLAIVPGLVAGDLERSKEMLKKFYGYGDYKIEGFAVAESQGEDSNAAEIVN